MVPRTSSKYQYKSSDKNNTSNESVSNSIIRGKIALQEAEDHIKLFEDFIQMQSIPNESDHLTKYNSIDCQIRDHSFHESDNSSKTDELSGIYQHVSNEAEFGLIYDMARTRKECERRNKDIQNDILYVQEREFSIGSLETDMTKSTQELNLKRKRPFDPNNLAVARRALVKTAAFDEDVILQETEQREKAKFRARPLPGGNYVKNDPYALTKAALGKVSEKGLSSNNILHRSVINNKRKDASELLNGSLQLSQSMSPSQKNVEKNKTNRNSKAAMAYDVISNMVIATSKEDVGDSSDLSSQEEQDLGALYQQISKLHAELSFKRIQCIETIQQIETEDVESLVSDNHNTCINSKVEDARGHPEQVSCNDSKEDQSESFEVTSCKNHSIKTKRAQLSNSQCPMTLYDRHNMWLKRIENKRKEAKDREEEELIRDVTGKPNLQGAKKSWARAKQQHDGIMKSLMALETSKKNERDEKERLLREKHVAEIERLKSLSKDKTKRKRRGIDKHMQANHFDKLSRPRVIQNKYVNEAKRDNHIYVIEEQQSLNKDSIKTKESDLSFADMNDKEFARMIRKLKAKAGRGERTMFGGDNETNDLNVDNDNRQSNVEEGCDETDHNELHTNVDDGDSIINVNHYTSSTAQAKIFAEMSEINEQNTKSNDLITKQKNESDVIINHSFSCPYERYESGEGSFFDRSSSDEIGRFRVRDARDFYPESLRRISVPFNDNSLDSSDGIWFLVGKKMNETKSNSQNVVTILFSRSLFNEEDAADWWERNKSEILGLYHEIE